MNKKKAEDFALKVAWIFHQSDYSKLRKAEGCGKLGDLPTTKKDKVNAYRAAKKMGIPDEEIHYWTGMSSKELGKMIRKETHRLSDYTMADKQVFLFVYCAGHGVADSQQYFVLNDASHNLFPVESKLRAMCKGSDGMFHIVAVYDICRSDLSKFKGLSRGDDSPHLEGGNGVNYVAINGTDPAGTVDAASTLAVTLFAECDEAASEHVNSLIRIPTCWVEFQGSNGMVEKTMMGKTYNIYWDTNAGGKPISNDNQEEMKSAPT